MYCGNCGKELPDQAAFCAECGMPVSAKKTAKPKINTAKLKKAATICIAVAVLLLAGFAGIKIYSYISSIPSENDIRMTANNLQNGGTITADGKWLYYVDQGLCKVKISDTSRQKVISSDIVPESMFYLGNKLYYYTFPGYCQLTSKGTGEDLGFSIFTQACIQSDGKHFYVTGQGNYDDSGVYSVKMNNTKKAKKISDIHPTELLLNGDHLYIISGWGSINDLPNENYGVWRIDKDGGNPIFLLDFCPQYMVFSADAIYYTNEDRHLCSMDFDGTNNHTFEDIYVSSGLNTADGYIFYVSADTQTIYRMNADGTEKTELNSFESESIYIVDDWLFYINEDFDDDIYQMSFDGTYNQPIY